ncbi:MAG: class I SAM-dependent methyltransferase [Patescibacteria group bacterium]
MITLYFTLSAAFILIGFVLYFFLSKSFSPIPYFPTNVIDIPVIEKELEIKDGDIVYDLGAGTGEVIFKLAEKSNAQFYAVEINPVLITILWIKWLIHSNRKNIHIVGKSLFDLDFSNATKIYLFTGPYVMNRILQLVAKVKPENLQKIISYRYDFGELPNYLESKYYRTVSDTGKQNLYMLNVRIR